MVSIGPPGFPLLELSAGAARPVPPRGRLGLFHFAILLPTRADLARFVLHLDDLGIRAGMSDHAVSEAVYLTDPDGLGIEIYADRPRESWRTEGNHLHMATEPLDAASLRAEALDTKWKGMPPGAVIGHVHLRVRNLDESSAFYHDALGFDRTVWSYPGALFLSAGGYHHHLGINTWAGDPGGPEAEEAQMLEWELVVPDHDSVRATAASLVKHGYANRVDGDAIVTADPSGTTLRISPRGALRLAGLSQPDTAIGGARFYPPSASANRA